MRFIATDSYARQSETELERAEKGESGRLDTGTVTLPGR